MGAERQINMHTNIQTHKHFSEKNFRKPGVRPQPAVSQLWARAWFKKYQHNITSVPIKLQGRREGGSRMGGSGMGG